MIDIDPQEVQLYLNRMKLPTTHVACRTSALEKDGAYFVVTTIRAVDPDEDDRTFTVVGALRDGDTALSIASELAARFLEAINGDDYERANADSRALGLH